jgi:hypothetical protein
MLEAAIGICEDLNHQPSPLTTVISSSFISIHPTSSSSYLRFFLASSNVCSVIPPNMSNELTQRGRL